MNLFGNRGVGWFILGMTLWGGFIVINWARILTPGGAEPLILSFLLLFIPFLTMFSGYRNFFIGFLIGVLLFFLIGLLNQGSTDNWGVIFLGFPILVISVIVGFLAEPRKKFLLLSLMRSLLPLLIVFLIDYEYVSHLTKLPIPSAIVNLEFRAVIISLVLGPIIEIIFGPKLDVSRF